MAKAGRQPWLVLTEWSVQPRQMDTHLLAKWPDYLQAERKHCMFEAEAIFFLYAS